MEKARYLYRVEHPEHGEVQVEAIDRLPGYQRGGQDLGRSLDIGCQGVHLRADRESLGGKRKAQTAGKEEKRRGGWP